MYGNRAGTNRDEGRRNERGHNDGKAPLCGPMPSKGGDRQKILFKVNSQSMFGDAREDVAQIYIL